MTVHDVIPLVAPQYHPLVYGIYFRRALPYLARHFDALIADSQSTASDMHRFLHTPAERIHTVPLAARWPVDQTTLHVTRKPFVLAVGTIEPRKNLLRVAQAFLQAKHEIKNDELRLKIAGGRGWGNTRMDGVLRTHQKHIDWLGYVSDQELEQLYREARMLVFPSLYEGFGLPVLEAMSLGCPVITSNRSSLPEVGGDAAVYVDPEDTDQITSKIVRLLAVPCAWQEASAKGLAQAALFSWTRCAEETVEVYKRVMAVR